MTATIKAPMQVHLHAFDTAYPGSMSERPDANYVRRDDPESLAAALIECIRARDREIEDLKAALAAGVKEGDRG